MSPCPRESAARRDLESQDALRTAPRTNSTSTHMEFVIYAANYLPPQQAKNLPNRPSCIFLIFFLEGGGGWELDAPWAEALGWGRSGHSRS